MKSASADESEQVADVYVQVLVLFQDALDAGYDHHVIAEALLHGARDVLAGDIEFWTVFARFKLLRWP